MTGGRASIGGCCFAGLAALAVGCDSQTVLGSEAGTDAAPWVPPVPDAGDPGWRDSTEPWPGPAYVPDCEHVDRQQFAVDVLAQPEGLYALAMWVESRRDGGGWVDLGRYLRIDFNDGGGWRNWDDRVCPEFGPGATCPRRLLGLVGGRAAGSVAEFLGPDIPLLVLLSPGTREAPGDAAPWLEPMVLDAFVVREDLAYAVSAGPDVKLLRWDGSTWSPDPAVLPYEDIRAIWADETDVFLVGGTGTVLSLEGEAWHIHDLGRVTDLQAVWGFAGDDVWVADAERGLHHFDGTSWTDVAWPDRSSESRCAPGVGTLDLWGVDGTLFLYSSYQLVRHDASGFATLAWWPPEFVPTTETGGYCVGGTTIVRVTGHAPDEVFLAVAVPPEADETCRTWPLRPFLLRWDGASFHWM